MATNKIIEATMKNHFDQYHVEYLAEQYERLTNLVEGRTELSKDKIQYMKRCFKSFDKDGNGVLDREEIFELLQVHFQEQGMKKKPSKQDIDDFFNKLDDDHSGEIEFAEFKEFMIETMCKKIMEPLREYLILRGINL